MRLALLSLLALIVAGLACAPAEARSRRAMPEGDVVVAESRFGNGSVSGAVRMTELGPQVQLPGGHWEYCRRSCSETLRVESIDFNWNEEQRIERQLGGFGNECGIFGCLEFGLGRRR